MSPLELVTEQLWQPALADPALRVVVDPDPDPGWIDVESYWLIPDEQHARMLLPRAGHRVTANAATAFAGLRRRRVNAVRLLGGAIARVGLPLSRHTVAVQVRVDGAGATAQLPLPRLARELGCGHLHASVGVRSGANRKATLSLHDESGTPVGYAKFGWNDVADGFVQTETQTLRALAGGAGGVRVPRVLATIDYFGHPVVVTEPLPLSVRGAQRGIEPPSTQEFHDLAPVVRRARASETAHFVSLQHRLATLAESSPVTAILHRSRSLADRVRASEAELAVVSRWHGDLSPWNAARDRDGVLWIWDWETAEDDALAGLDPLHWACSVRRIAARSAGDIGLSESLAAAGRHLDAVGNGARAQSLVAAVYALTVVERACALAASEGSWRRVWISPEQLDALLRQAESLLDGEV